MPPVPDTLPLDLPLAVISEFSSIGAGDAQRGARIALDAVRTLAETPAGARIDPDTAVVRILFAAAKLTETADLVSRHIERYEIERRTFFDDVARLGRIEESKPT